MNESGVTYLPPSEQQINQFAREVCESLAHTGDNQYLHPEVVGGLADFLAFASQVFAKALNEGRAELLDKGNA